MPLLQSQQKDPQTHPVRSFPSRSEEPHRNEAVSYTHLFLSRIAGPCNLLCGLDQPAQHSLFAYNIGIGSVSYTHLDVYKRQLRYWADSSE